MTRRAWLAFAAISLISGVPYLFIKIAVDGGAPMVIKHRLASLDPRATMGASLAYVNPVIAAALGVVLLDERPGAGAVAGLLLILAGSWLSTGGRLPPPVQGLVGRRAGPRSAWEREAATDRAASCAEA
jgi:EamA-like transporter family protein